MSKYEIIDSHCHIYPDSIAAKAVKAVDNFYEGRTECCYDGTVHTLISSGTGSGISRFVVHSVATAPRQVSRINSFIARSVRQSQGRFTGLGAMHPDAEDLAGDLEEIRRLGLSGVKIHPDVQQFYVDSPKAMSIYEMLEDQGLPVLVHTGDFRYDYSSPQRVARVLRRFPGLKFVGAHLGGWSVWEEAARVLADFPNLYVDTSSSFYLLKPGDSRRLILAYGEERVMFGTDYPFWHQKPDIDYLLGLDLPDEALRKIFRDNACRRFDICEPDAV